MTWDKPEVQTRRTGAALNQGQAVVPETSPKNTQSHTRLRLLENTLRSRPDSLDDWIHGSDPLRQDLQLPVGHVVESRPRVAGQHHLRAEPVRLGR